MKLLIKELKETLRKLEDLDKKLQKIQPKKVKLYINDPREMQEKPRES